MTGEASQSPRREASTGEPAALSEYLAGDLRYRVATPDDDETLRRLLRDNDMASWVRLSLEREPSYFAGASLMGPSTTVIAEEAQGAGRPVGTYTHALLPAHLNGQRGELGYLGGLRVDPAFRQRLRVLRHGFESIPALVDGLGAQPVLFTSIARDNRAARRVLEANLAGMPVYTPVGDLETLAISTRRGRRSGRLRRATTADVPALATFHNCRASEYQFAPLLTESWLMGLSGAQGLQLDDFWLLDDGGELRACFALWDQRMFKQTVVRGYRFPLDRLRPAVNLWLSFRERLPLPPAGQRLESVFIAFAAFDGTDEQMTIEVMRHALHEARRRGAAAGVIGVSPNNPLRKLLRRHFAPAVYHTCVETVALSGNEAMELDGRPPQPEVAVL